MKKQLKNIIKESFEVKAPDNLQNKVFLKIKKQEEFKPLLPINILLVLLLAFFGLFIAVLLFFQPTETISIPLPDYQLMKTPIMIACVLLLLKFVLVILEKKSVAKNF